MKLKGAKKPHSVEDDKTAVQNRVLEILRGIRRLGTPGQAIEAAEIEKLILARSQSPLAQAA